MLYLDLYKKLLCVICSEYRFGDDLWDVVGWESVLKKKNIILSMNKYRETFCIDLVLTVPQI
jgi:hypothetical protein